ncbi:hypothetical protein LINPERHAP1_LOCUS12317 [Linum perenne]
MDWQLRHIRIQGCSDCSLGAHSIICTWIRAALVHCWEQRLCVHLVRAPGSVSSEATGLIPADVEKSPGLLHHGLWGSVCGIWHYQYHH